MENQKRIISITKTDSNRNRKISIIFVLVVILQLGMMIFFGSLKKGFQMDEILSFAHSNSFFKPYLFPTLNSDRNQNDQDDSFFNRWVPGDEFKNYVTLSEEERFRYDSVIFNLSKSVHPPLFHTLLHTINSFFPGGINKWHGLVLNFVLFAACQITLFSLASQLLKSRWLALLSCALWGFGTSAINNVMFIRMYVLLTFLVLLFTYVSMGIVRATKVKLFWWVIILIVTLLGSLTQYYFLIYAFFHTFIITTSFINQKLIKKAIIYGLSVSIGVIFSFLLNPATLNHLLASYRGKQAVYDLMYSKNDPLLFYFSIIIRELIGIRLPDTRVFGIVFIALSLIALFIASLFLIRFYLTQHKSFLSELIKFISKFSTPEKLMMYIAITSLLYFYTIVKIAPGMEMYADRYIFCIFPILSMLLIWGINYLLRKTSFRSVFMILTVLFFISMTHITNDRNYRTIYLSTDTLSEGQLSVFSGANCIIFTSLKEGVHSWANDLQKCSRILIAYQLNNNIVYPQVTYPVDNKKTVLVLSDEFNTESILNFLAKDTPYHQAEFLFFGYYSDYYYNFYELRTSND